MNPFLKQVAYIYTLNERQKLADFCFVFPNKRSATFFTHFLKKEFGSAGGILPEVTNITDFIGTFSPLLTEANRYDCLFTLFDEYRKLPGIDTDFDRFLFWGEMLMSDFNDVDRYLVDADALFVNIKRLKEISSNYLTDEQREVIRRYWGEDRGHDQIDRFWNHLDNKGDSPQHAKFVKLWEVLQPLYHAYRDRLGSEGLATSGMLYRNAAESLDCQSADSLPFDRYIFVGFNVLSTSEIKIFSRLQALGCADFYWDFNSSALTMRSSRAARFMQRNIKEFPSRYPLMEKPIETLPDITILGVPSNIGQVKAAGMQLDRWINDGSIDNPQDAIDTAIVLPDESLFIPMVHSVPDSIGSLNVTMGFPMRLSPIASLLRNIVSLQLRSRMHAGRRMYFYEDLRTLLTDPALRSVDVEGCRKLEKEIRNRRLFTVASEQIIEYVPKLERIFAPIDDPNNRKQVFDYVIRICDFLDSDDIESDNLRHQFVESYRIAASELLDATDRFGIDMRGSSFFKLIERAISSDTVRFTGEPLCGLQVMGVLETRALDFKNIIMLSMNERVFPRRHYSRSFIPNALRHGYGMSTIDFQESIFAYYFYRLISRAKRVTLIYDARSVGGSKSSEMSRYLAQLLYLFNGKGTIKHRLGLYNAQRFTPPAISVRKTDDILRKMERFKAGGDANLSASALNCYINCPLNFYLQHVEGFNAENEITDYMDSSTYGTVVHEVAQNIFDRLRPKGSTAPILVTEQMLKPLIEPGNTTVEHLITIAINRNYNRLEEAHLLAPLLGESLVLGKVIHAAILSMLKADIAMCPFTFIAAEHKMQGTLKINDRLSVNVRQIIDRIDNVDGITRFVDYKTGSDTLNAPSVESLFETSRDTRAKAIMQLLFYCHIYNSLGQTDIPIRPVIYKLLDISAKGVEPLKINRQPIDDYHSVNDAFVNLLYRKIEEIFDPEVPFTQTDKTHSCTFCQFKPMCGRE